MTYSEPEIKKANEFVEKFAFSKKDHLYSDVKSGLACGAVFDWILRNFRMGEEKELPEVAEGKIEEWQDIPDLDAQIRVIKEPTKDFDKGTVEIGLQESLGEQGGDILTEFYNKKPTLEQIRKDIIKRYKETKAKINEEVAMGITAKSGRDEMIETAIDKVLVPKYRVVAFLRVVTEPEEDELFDTIEEAEDEKETLELMQSEDRFEIEKV